MSIQIEILWLELRFYNIEIDSNIEEQKIEEDTFERLCTMHEHCTVHGAYAQIVKIEGKSREIGKNTKKWRMSKIE